MDSDKIKNGLVVFDKDKTQMTVERIYTTGKWAKVVDEKGNARWERVANLEEE